jgi:DNA segregation ATPase FtsK/SpoIIIE, S-DNA-T family
MTISQLAPWYQGRIIRPVLGKVRSTRYVDCVSVRLVSGQSAAEVADCAENLAHGFGAMLCRVRTARSGAVLLEFVRRDALAAIVPAAPMLARPDLRALEVGRREDGLPWLIRLHGTHVLIAGATGAGKASLLWGLVRAMFPLMRAGLVRVLAADPKFMELAYGRAVFDTHGTYAATRLDHRRRMRTASPAAWPRRDRAGHGVRQDQQGTARVQGRVRHRARGACRLDRARGCTRRG